MPVIPSTPPTPSSNLRASARGYHALSRAVEEAIWFGLQPALIPRNNDWTDSPRSRTIGRSERCFGRVDAALVGEAHRKRTAYRTKARRLQDTPAGAPVSSLQAIRSRDR